MEQSDPAVVARLLDVAACEQAALDMVSAGVARLQEAQAAKAALVRLPPAVLKAGLRHRHDQAPS